MLWLLLRQAAESRPAGLKSRLRLLRQAPFSLLLLLHPPGPLSRLTSPPWGFLLGKIVGGSELEAGPPPCLSLSGGCSPTKEGFHACPRSWDLNPGLQSHSPAALKGLHHIGSFIGPGLHFQPPFQEEF